MGTDSPVTGRELANKLTIEYLETAKAGNPSHMEAMKRIRDKSPFTQTQLRGWVKKIGQTPKGIIELTIQVPYEQRAEALELINSYGLPLDIYLRLIGEEPPDGE